MVPELWHQSNTQEEKRVFYKAQATRSFHHEINRFFCPYPLHARDWHDGHFDSNISKKLAMFAQSGHKTPYSQLSRWHSFEDNNGRRDVTFYYEVPSHAKRDGCC